jgi:hypothetical protein
MKIGFCDLFMFGYWKSDHRGYRITSTEQGACIATASETLP